MNAQHKATLIVNDKTYDFPLLKPTLGNEQIDINSLGKDTGWCFYL